ncbi:MAG: hypothetical protein HY913_19780 [Desulfomonile tiedjei]|nr:hypothetical protein [Desulfomonile tiedjei]
MPQSNDDKLPLRNAMQASLEQTIGKSDLSKLARDLDEVALDSLLEPGTLRDIPILGTFAKGANVVLSVRDFFFLRKLSKVLLCLDSVPLETRNEFSNRLKSDPNFRQKLMDSVILLIDRLDDMEKAEFFGKIFSAYVSSQIGYDDFRMLSYALDRLYLTDLHTLKEFYSGPTPTQAFQKTNYDSLWRLTMCGLVCIADTAAVRARGEFGLNGLGKQFTRIALR